MKKKIFSLSNCTALNQKLFGKKSLAKLGSWGCEGGFAGGVKGTREISNC